MGIFENAARESLLNEVHHLEGAVLGLKIFNKMLLVLERCLVYFIVKEIYDFFKILGYIVIHEKIHESESGHVMLFLYHVFRFFE